MTMVYLVGAIAVFGVAGWFAWRFFGSAGGFNGNRDARIGISEVSTIDAKRKLLLIRRDGVEHLVMTGGPIDIVIEQGIQPLRRPAAATAAQPGHEPRLAAQAAGGMPSEAMASGELQPGFGRLRQRAGQAAPQDPYQRGEPPQFSTGSGNR